MQFPSLTLIFSGLFIAYTCHSIWSIASLYFPPKCSQSTNCVEAYLSSNPKLQLLLATSLDERISRNLEFEFIESLDVELGATESRTISIPIPFRTRRNGTLFIHTFLTKRSHGKNLPAILRDQQTTYTVASFTQYHIPEAKAFNLLHDSEDAAATKKHGRPITHLRSKVIVNILDHRESLPRNNLPMDVAQVLSFAGSQYLPVLQIDMLGSRLEDLVPVNSSVTKIPATFIYTPISFGKLRLWMQFTQALQMLRVMGFTEKDIDELKGIFADTNIVFLCATFVVSAMHLLFDFLAFKNDVSFWKDRNDMVGVSSRTLLWRAFSHFVIFLYLFNEKTSMLVVVPAAIGTIIETWKVKKAFRITVEWRRLIPKVVVGKFTDEEAETEKYDSISMKYLSYILYPLCFGGAIYSLLYTSHRSWFSWLIQSVVNGVYAFGFLFMLPQLFVNYKLKSVAHLPWRAFMYKAFNTFIDDVFAFIITMPTAHRVACFRDDVVFLVYLYQRWLYPVDKKRVNEFGSTGEDDQDKKDK